MVYKKQVLELGLHMRIMPCAVPCRAVPVRIPHAGRPCEAEMSEISQSSRTTMVESSIKSEHNLYLACEDSLLALSASTVH